MDNRKRSRDEYVEELRSSSMFIQDPKRMRLLLETKRIVNNCLPFTFGEYEETRVLDELISIPSMKTSFYHKKVLYIVRFNLCV